MHPLMRDVVDKLADHIVPEHAPTSLTLASYLLTCSRCLSILGVEARTQYPMYQRREIESLRQWCLKAHYKKLSLDILVVHQHHLASERIQNLT